MTFEEYSAMMDKFFGPERFIDKCNKQYWRPLPDKWFDNANLLMDSKSVEMFEILAKYWNRNIEERYLGET